MRYSGLIIPLMGLWIFSCQSSVHTPKPRAYPRIDYPVHAYQSYEKENCPFSFDYPVYAEIQDKDEPCWFDVFIPQFDARVHCSYVAVHSPADYDNLIGDAFKIASTINERANYMEEEPIHNSQGVGGLSLSWTGPAASPLHFYLTDTTSHFFIGALYFDSRVNPDSLAPIVTFLRKDVDRMISSFAWK